MPTLRAKSPSGGAGWRHADVLTLPDAVPRLWKDCNIQARMPQREPGSWLEFPSFRALPSELAPAGARDWGVTPGVALAPRHKVVARGRCGSGSSADSRARET